MTKTELPRETQLIAFFVTKCAGKRPLGRTHLMKMLYLADYEARRYLGKPISSLEYVWHHFGPYHESLVSAIQTLQDQSVLSEERVLHPTGKLGYRYRPGTATNISYGFSPIEMEILRYVCTTYSDIKLQALLGEVVYETEPMQDAKARDARGDKLNMEIANNLRNTDYGITFEELHARIQRVRAGHYLSHTEAISQLADAHDRAA